MVEDIIDTGRTIEKLIQLLNEVHVKSIKVASLFTKRNGCNARKPNCKLWSTFLIKLCALMWYKVAGFELPDKFIVGINMDFNERYRDLNVSPLTSSDHMLLLF